MKIHSIILCLLLAAVTGGLGQTADGGKKTDFVIKDGGLTRQFELALDETDEKQADGKSTQVKGAKGAGLGEMRQKALAKEKDSGRRQDLVLYEKGKPRSEATRRVETRKVLVKVAEGFDADAAAAKFGAVSVEMPAYAPGHVIFTFKEPGESLTKAEEIKAHPGVQSAEPMLAKQQRRRLIPNDTFFSYNASNPGYQWHLRNTGQSPGTAGIDANVISVWDSFLGTGVRIGIVDDGLEVAHPDLSPNADTVNDHDWNDATPNDPTGNPSSDTHGTACAGVAGARGNNGSGVSGVAPNATLVGLRLIAGNVSDAQEAEALTWENDIIQIYSNSWGPADDGSDLVDAGPLVKQAFVTGATTGRSGRGTIWLWAGGNGGDVGDNSNYDGYANSIYTIAIGALNDNGGRSNYSEPGANLIVSAPSNDNTGVHRGITTTTTNGGYRHSFGGTSSATPLAAGVVALLLQSNPNLGWRDVQEILIRSATKVNPAQADWINNGAGYHFNHNYGGGLINAQAAVTMAAGWTNLGPQVTQEIAQTGLNVAIPDGNTTGTTRTFTIPGSVLMRVEHATVRVTATHGRRGDLDITLTSPSGTASKLCAAHGDPNLNMDWTFSTVRSWGENAAGNWTLKVADLVGGTPGTLTSATLTLYGANIAPPTAPPAITSPLTQSGNVDSPLSYQITASQNPQTFSAAPLPPGVSLSASGLITGTPTQQGTFNVTLGATNGLGTGDATLVITIGPRIPTPPAITSTLTATAVLNVPFYYQITATNSPTSFVAANLPPGLALNMSTGVISGTPSATGGYNVSINATNADGQDTQTLVITVNSTASALAQALDAPQLVFTTGGNVAWTTPASLTHDGVDAAQSGAIGHNQQTWLETTVVGPAYVSFWFRLDSEPEYDFFRFYIDGVSQWESSGFHQWRRLGFFVPSGVHTARWVYTKDDLYISGADRLWLDQVTVHGEQAFLADVLDNPNLTWRQSGSGSWVMQDRRQVDGVDAFISPFFLDHGRSSAIETVVMGPGTISFWWTVASEPGYDFFRFEMDDEIYAEISGFGVDPGTGFSTHKPWEQETYYVPPGLHTLRWRYIKDEIESVSLDSAWLDTIFFTQQFASGPPYAQWLAANYPAAQLGNGEITGPGADGDGDFRSNLEEYAFGGSPLIQDFAQPVSAMPSGAEVHFGFSTNTTKTDLLITPQLSDDLANWLDDTGEFVSQTGNVMQWRVRVPQSAGRKFMKLRATLTP
jgi:subtilisin-like proprotein convertase family protein